MSRRPVDLLAAAALAAVPLLLAATSAFPADEPAPDAYERTARRYRSFFDFGGFGQSLDTVLPGGYAERWKAQLSLEGTYTDNFGQDRRKRDAFFSSGALGLGWSRRSTGLTADADYRFSTPLYRTDAAEGKDLTTQVGAASLRWRASERITFSAGGSVTRNNQDAVEEGPAAVGRSYRNRSDQYAAQTQVDWRLSAGTSGRASYGYLYRDYVSGEAEGDNSLNHRAGADFSMRLGRADAASLSTSYEFQKEFLDEADVERTGTLRRETYGGTAAWEHTLSQSAGTSTTLRTSYGAERSEQVGAPDYWSHSLSAALSRRFSPRTQASLGGGYEWVLEEDENAQGSWTGNLTLNHRFSDRTSVDLAASQDWEQRPVSSRGDFTQIARTRRVAGTARTRLSRYARGSLEAHYEEARLTGFDDEQYWELGTRCAVEQQIGEKEFWGAGLGLRRRRSDVTQSDGEDSYVLRSADAYYRRELWEHLSVSLRYTFAERTRLGAGTLDPYTENRIYGALNAGW